VRTLLELSGLRGAGLASKRLFSIGKFESAEVAMVRAAFVGAGIAVVGMFLLTLFHGAFFGVNPSFDDEAAYGTEGGINSVKLLVLAGIAVWPFLVAGAVGVVIGVLSHLLFRHTARNPKPTPPPRRSPALTSSSLEEAICPILVDAKHILRPNSSKALLRFLASVGTPLAMGSERPAPDRPA